MANQYSRTYNSNTRVKVSRSNDTDLDGTTQVPGQSPKLTAWLTKNLGHPTNWRANHGRRRTTRHVHKTTCTSHTNRVKPHVNLK
ncbi:hypothetical protein Taro_030907 [Colocasia esculenta]|uniref:Uncharacterized protein n=1 Tax=Colocasia esculenta TaxID=4460 RepID=A0A843VXG3_COLES|nr:hypothetical protein [Colocasia esculenta]